LFSRYISDFWRLHLVSDNFRPYNFAMEFQDFCDGCLLTDPEADLNAITLNLPTTAGVCLFSTEDNQLLLCLPGANLRNLVRRRMAEVQVGEKTRRIELQAIVRRIWFRCCYSPFEMHLSYFHIAQAAFPDSYLDLFPSLDVWFVYIDPNTKFPYFASTRYRNSKSGQYWGPFVSRRLAVNCVEVLQNVFDLCRCPEILEKAPAAAACAYAQMNRCAAVCDGSTPAEDYRLVVEQAKDFLNNGPQAGLELWKQQMQKYSNELQFEKAQQIKDKIREIKKLLTTAYRWMRPLDEFLVLAFQPGPKVKQTGRRAHQVSITTFLIGAGWVDQMESFPLDECAEGCKSLLDHINLALLQDRKSNSAKATQHLFAWAAHLLDQKKSKDPGLYVPFAESLSAEDLSKLVIEHFCKPIKNKD